MIFWSVFEETYSEMPFRNALPSNIIEIQSLSKVLMAFDCGNFILKMSQKKDLLVMHDLPVTSKVK